MDGDGRILRQPIDMPAVATADPTAAEAASPRRVHNDTHSALPTRVTMVINEFSKRGGNLSRTAAVLLKDLNCCGDHVIGAALRPALLHRRKPSLNWLLTQCYCNCTQHHSLDFILLLSCNSAHFQGKINIASAKF